MSPAPEEETPASFPVKEEPDALVLRGRPRPVVRFRRGLVIGGAALVSTILVGVAWLALEPPSFQLASDKESARDLASRGAPDALADAPSSYGDVPQLGPPLPGDLGRPILEHRRSLAAPPDGASMPNPAGEAERARQAADAERQRLAAEQEAIRKSALLVPVSGAAPGTEGAAVSVPAPSVAMDFETSSIGGAGISLLSDRTSRQRRFDFEPSAPAGANAQRLEPAPSPWTLVAGTVIPASLITGINSDLPGIVLAQVTENVYDTISGNVVLVPQGARLVGSYDNVVAFGQRRALLVWQRIVLPDGSSVRLDNLPASDVAGYAGLEDRVDFHTWRLLKGVALSTLLGVGTELGLGSGESDLVRAIREATQQNAARAGEQITSRNLEVQPTITVRPGWPLRAIIHKDLVLRPWRGSP